MKNILRYILQRCLGFKKYLFLFSIISIKRIETNSAEEEFMYFVKLVPNEGIILDIGANIGITTIPLANQKDKAIIYSFEPMPENIATLTRVVEYFKLSNVKIFDFALGETNGELTMVMPVISHVKMQGLSHIQFNGTDQKPSIGNEIKVIVKTLDTIPEINAAKKITAIKIDVENFEYFVLKGGRQLLLNHKPIIYCELWKNEMRELTIKYLGDLGYSVKVFHNKQLMDYRDSAINFFFIPANFQGNEI